MELEQDGHRGYGEAAEAAYYGAAIEEMTAAIEADPAPDRGLPAR